MKVIFVDAGHGGINPVTGEYATAPEDGKKYRHGNKGYHGGGWFYEGVSNRLIARRFMAAAFAAGFHCIPVYHPWIDTPLQTRTDLANQIEADLNINSIFISFHSNAFKGISRGFNVFHYPTSSKGKQLANKVNAYVAPYFAKNGSQRAENVQTASFHVLKHTNMPAILLEHGFFDQEKDADLLMDGIFVDGLVQQIVSSLTI